MDFFDDLLFLKELMKIADENKMPYPVRVQMLTEAMADILAERKETMSPELKAKVDAMLERERERLQRRDN